MADFSRVSGTGPAPSGAARSADYELVIRPETSLSWRDLGELWRHRDLLLILALRDVSVRYRQALLGVAWAVVQPLVQMLIFTLLFHRFAGIASAKDVPYPVFCFSGLTVWMLFAASLSSTSDSLVKSSNLLTKVYFPRLIIPLASTLTAIIDFAVGFALLLPLLLYFGVPLRPSLVLCLPVAALAVAYAVAIGLWTAALNVRFRDVRHALPFAIQLLVYLTPVFYPPSLLGGRFGRLVELNPMAAVVEAYRAAIFGTPVDLGRLGLGALVMLAVGLGGLAWFRRMERTFADRV